MIYRQYLLDLYKNPRHRQKIDNPSCTISQENLSCGDKIEVSLKIENDIVKDIGFEGTGCVLTVTGASAACEIAKGKKINDIQAMENDDIIKELGLEGIGYNRVDCVTLGIRAIKEAISKF